jgi:hypothetical protein
MSQIQKMWRLDTKKRGQDFGPGLWLIIEDTSIELSL